METERKPNADLGTIFQPRSIAVMGASGGMENAGARFINAFYQKGFSGKLYAVNYKGKPCENFSTFRSLQDIPDPVDHVYVAVPAAAVPGAIRDCVAKGVHSAAVFTSGFRETGSPEGLALEEKILSIAREGGVRLIGPNCMGIYSPRAQIAYRFDYPMTLAPVSFISQSGGVAITGIISSGERGMGYEKVVSIGNECDISAPELIGFFTEDPNTEIIMAYLEGSRRIPELFAAVENAAQKKPVLLLKGGGTKAGSRAVASHTGALAGEHRTWQAATKQANAIDATGFEEFIDSALTFLKVKRPAGRRLGIVSISGGLCVLLTDLAERYGFAVPMLSKSTMKELGKFFVDVGTSVKNPLDLAITFFYPDKISRLFEELDKDENIDSVVFLIMMEYITMIDDRMPGYLDMMANAVAEALSALKKPILLTVMHTTRDEDRQRFLAPIINSGTAVYPTVERALTALNQMMRYYDIRDARRQYPE